MLFDLVKQFKDSRCCSGRHAVFNCASLGGLPRLKRPLVHAVATANPKTIVVVESGTAVTMPWIDKVSGVLEAWYAGSKGADAVANILFGDVNPSGSCL